MVLTELERLRDANQQLTFDLQRTRSTLASREAALEEYDEELRQVLAKQSASDALSGTVKELEGKIVFLTKQMEERDNDLNKACESKEMLEKKVVDLEREIKDLQERITDAPINDTVASDSGLLDEISRLEKERNEALFEFEKRELVIRELENDKEQLVENIDDVSRQNNEQRKILKELREQVIMLESEVNESKQLNTPMNQRGNSMFAEFADERKKLEMDMKKLYERYNSARREVVQLQNELDEARMEARSRRGYAVNVKCRCSEMDIEVIDLRSKVSKLESDVSKYQRESLRSILGNKNTDGLLKARVQSIGNELGHLRQEKDRFRTERDSLLKENMLLQTKFARASFTEQQLKEDVEVLKKQLHLAEVRELHKLENGNSEAGLDSEGSRDKSKSGFLAVAKVVELVAKKQEVGKSDSLKAPSIVVPKTPAPAFKLSKAQYEKIANFGRDTPLTRDASSASSTKTETSELKNESFCESESAAKKIKLGPMEGGETGRMSMAVTRSERRRLGGRQLGISRPPKQPAACNIALNIGKWILNEETGEREMKIIPNPDHPTNKAKLESTLASSLGKSVFASAEKEKKLEETMDTSKTLEEDQTHDISAISSRTAVQPFESIREEEKENSLA